MSNHNFIKILTDNQWYNFICGLLVGYRSFKPDGEVPDVIVGGSGQIGQQALAVQYDSSTLRYDIPVFTHDVDISYSGFLSIIRWNTNDLYVSGISEGTAGSLSYGTQGSKAGYAWYQLKPGELIVDKLLPYGQQYDQEEILFILHAVVLNPTKVNSGIEIQVFPNKVPTGIASDDDSVLSAWVTNPDNGLFDLKYITPEVNVKGGIYGEIPKYSGDIPVNIPTKQGNFKHEATIAFYGTTQRCFFDPNTYYHSQNLVIHDDLGRDIGIKEFDVTYHFDEYYNSEYLDIFDFVDVNGENGWRINYNIDKGTGEQGKYINIHVHGTRDDYIKETHTAFTFVFNTNPVYDHGEVGIYAPVNRAQTFSAIDINSYDTNYDFVYLDYRPVMYDESGKKYEDSEYIIIDKTDEPSEQPGYQEYSLPVWSPSEQVIKIEIGGGSYVYYYYKVEPGWNYIPIHVPYVSPIKWEYIKVESTYYLLVHRIIKIRDGGSPGTVEPQEYQINIIDDITFEDFNSNTQNTRTIYTSDTIDELLFDDSNTNSSSTRRIFLSNSIDEVQFNDFSTSKILGLPETKDSESEISVNDFVDVQLVQKIVYDNDTVEVLTFNDIVNTKILGQPDEHTNIENIELSDSTVNNINNAESIYIEDELPSVGGDATNIEDFMAYEITQ